MQQAQQAPQKAKKVQRWPHLCAADKLNRAQRLQETWLRCPSAEVQAWRNTQRRPPVDHTLRDEHQERQAGQQQERNDQNEQKQQRETKKQQQQPETKK